MYYATFKNSHFRASETFLRPGNESEERKLKNANRLPGGPPPGRLVVCIHSFGNHLIPKK